MRKITRPVGFVFVVVFIIQLFRIFYLLDDYSQSINYFKSGQSEAFFILTWVVILILLAYSIILMYNKRLIIEVNVQEEKFSKAFHAAPFIILLSKFDDGDIFEVNNYIQSIAGYQPKELIGLKTKD